MATKLNPTYIGNYIGMGQEVSKKLGYSENMAIFFTIGSLFLPVTKEGLLSGMKPLPRAAIVGISSYITFKILTKGTILE